MAKNSWIIPTLIVGGLFIVALSLFISFQSQNQGPSARPVARLTLNFGNVSVFRQNRAQKEIAAKHASIYSADSIETGADGDATLEFDSAYRIRILENSLVTVEQEDSRYVLIIKRGDVEVENHGREGSVYVSREGSRWTATEYELSYKKQMPPQTMPDAPSTDAVDEKPLAEGLQAQQIQDTLNGQRSSFFKCYTQLLQKTPGVVGQASISFTILNSGKVSQAMITNSSLADEDFKECLKEAIRRVEFKSYSGEPITTVFPLRFE